MRSLNHRVKQRLCRELIQPLSSYTPGMKCQVYQGGQLKINLNLGHTAKYYDLASMTKQIFTVPAIMYLVEENQLSLDTDIGHYLWWWPHRGITIRSLLNQTSGLKWWRPFYKKLSGQNDHHYRWDQLKQLIYRSPPIKGQGCVYSDLGFMTLGFILEEVHNQDLHQIWKTKAENSMLSGIHFNLNHQLKHSKSLYAPTEKCPWRQKTLQGEVHDDNCWALGGVSSHAGLFGSIEDVSQWGLLLRKSWRQKSGSSMASHKMIKKFTQTPSDNPCGDWALGFWKRSHFGSSSGDYFSNSSFGCLGFTGTSLWYDPKADLLVTLLSNRVHPSRKNNLFKNLRPILHNIIREEIKK